MNLNKLPEVKQKKKIDLRRFVELAKKVKQSFQEEDEYLKKINHGNNNSTGVLLNN